MVESEVVKQERRSSVLALLELGPNSKSPHSVITVDFDARALLE
jgi:hypothetical protein